MRLIITGSPGVGKTSVAKILGIRLKHTVLNEKQFAMDENIGKWDPKEDELIIPLDLFAKSVDRLFSEKENSILEGHLLCEIKTKADYVIVIRVDPEILETRLHTRSYSEEKVQDNVFCEGIDYCKKHVLRNYPKDKVLEVESGKNIKETLNKILMGLKEKGAKL